MAFRLPEDIANSLVPRLEQIAEKNNYSLSGAISRLGGPNSAASEWKKNKAKPSLAAVVAFANLFDVSLDYLVLGKKTDTPVIQGVTGVDEELLRKFHALTPDLQDRLMSYADGLLAAMPQKENELGEKLSG